MIQGNDDKWLVVKLLSVEGKFVKAHEYGEEKEGDEEIELTQDEKNWVEKIRNVWSGILKSGVEDDTDFFGAGAGSMDVVRLIEEVNVILISATRCEAYFLIFQVKEVCNVTLSNEEVFMATQFKDFVRTLVVVSRGGGGKKMQGRKLNIVGHRQTS